MGDVIKVECPACHEELWIDLKTQKIIQHKKSKKTNHTSFEDLILSEKKKKEEVDEKFLSAKKLEQEKKRKAEELFRKSFK